MKLKKQEIIEDEMLDLVDEHDQVVTTMLRSHVYEQNLFAQMRSVWLMIKNSKGQLWILRRSYDCKSLPGFLDGSVAGHVKAGESYVQALHREAMEEIGIDMSNISYRLLGKLTPQQDGVFCFAQVYEVDLEETPQFWNQKEFCEWFWLTPEELMQKIKNGDKHKSILPMLLKKFYTC